MIETQPLRALVDIGFIALSRGLDRHAEAIFAGVTAARPENETGPLGTALVALLRGDAATAVKILRRLPPTDTARVFYGLALMRSGDLDTGRSVLDDVAATASDPAIAELGRSFRGDA